MGLSKFSRIRSVFVIIFTLFISYPMLAEDSLILGVDPVGALPLGSSSDTFQFGFGSHLDLKYSFGEKRIFNLGIKGGYLYLPLESADGISVLTIGGGPLLSLPLSEKFSLSLAASASYYYWIPTGWDVTDENNGGGFTYDGEFRVSFSLSDRFDIRAGVGYGYYHDLYNGLTFSIGTKILLAQFNYPARKTREEKMKPQLLDDKNDGVDLNDFSLRPVYPILYKYYDNNPIGSVFLYNYENTEIDNIKVTFFVERYMDNPMDVSAPTAVAGKEKIEIDLYGLFTEDVLEIVEGNKASAKVVLQYTLKNKTYSQEYNPVIEFYNRNALSWDDDRKIAAFVNAKDPEILTFSRNVTNWMQEVKNLYIDDNLQKALALFEAVKNKNIRYEVDPATPFSEMYEQEQAVDFLQFPRQTLDYTSGDCDDLSILFNSLLEASGVETAFITIPGHIYIAFALKINPSSARRSFTQADNLIITDDKVWFPLEITMIQKNFLDAWEAGAKEWRENNAREQAGFYPTRDSWRLFQAVGFSEDLSSVDLPSKNIVLNGFSNTLKTFINREIYPQVAKIQSRIQEQGDLIKFRNQLAVLYAKYGLMDMAEEEFQRILRRDEYLPALVNMGNIFFLKKIISGR